MVFQRVRVEFPGINRVELFVFAGGVITALMKNPVLQEFLAPRVHLKERLHPGHDLPYIRPLFCNAGFLLFCERLVFGGFIQGLVEHPEAGIDMDVGPCMYIRFRPAYLGAGHVRLGSCLSVRIEYAAQRALHLLYPGDDAKRGLQLFGIERYLSFIFLMGRLDA